MISTEGWQEIDVTQYLKNIASQKIDNNGFYISFKKYLAIDESASEKRGERQASFNCDTIIEWTPSSIQENELRYYHTKVYQCREGGSSVWCGAQGYEPDGIHGSNAWDCIGDCNPHKTYFYSSNAAIKEYRPMLKIIYDGIVDIELDGQLKSKIPSLSINRNKLLIKSFQNNSFDLKLFTLSGKSILKRTINPNGQCIKTIELEFLGNGYYIGVIETAKGAMKFNLLKQ